MVKEFNVTSPNNLQTVSGFNATDIIPIVRKDPTTGALSWVNAPGSLLAGSSFVPWTANTTYSVGSMVIYNGALWKTEQTFTSGDTFDGSSLTQLTPNFSIDPNTKKVVFNDVQLSNSEITSSLIDVLTNVASTWQDAQGTRSLAQRLDMLADIRDWGVVDDPNGKSTDNNTNYLLKALANTSGTARLHIPSGLTIVVNPLIIPTSNIALQLDGTLQLANNSAASSSVRANLIDLQGSNVSITGSGILDGNRANQTWTTGQVVGGITSNTWETTTTELVDPTTATAKPISNIDISGITIQNVGNWPISLGYVSNAHVRNVKITESGNSPQFFASADNCSVTGCTISNIEAAGWSCYVGNRNVVISQNTITNCYQGITVFSESDSRTPSNDILVAFNSVSNCRDGAIVFETGGLNPTPIQIRCTAFGNRCSYNNTGGSKSTASISTIGCLDPFILYNEVYGDGIQSTGQYPGTGFYADQTTTGLVFEGNTFDSIGSTQSLGTGVVLYNPTNAIIKNNKIRDTQKVMTIAFNGVLGSGCIVGGNEVSPLFTGTVWNLEPSSDTIIDRQRITTAGPVISTGGEVFRSGYVALSSSLYTASGTNTATATVITTQTALISSGTGAVRLPTDAPTGSTILITNATTETVLVYPSTGTAIDKGTKDSPIELNPGISGQYTFTQAGVWVTFIPIDVADYLSLMSPVQWSANTNFIAPQLLYYHDPITGSITLYSVTRDFKSTDTFDDSNLESIISSPPTASEMRMFHAASPTANEIIGAFICSQSGTLRANFVGCNAAILTAPSAPYVITVNKNGVSVGTITFDTDGSSTFTSNETTTAANDIITVVAPSTTDATAAGIILNFSILND